MRIAISGSHRSGKSTLVQELSLILPSYTTVDEPYHVMEEDGYEFCHPPSLEDFEAQLEHSIASLNEGGVNLLFDRCPVDFFAYLSVHRDADSFAVDRWLPRLRAAVQTLDLVALVPIETRDRIALSASDEDADFRLLVDEKLQEILLEDPYELKVNVVEVAGDPVRRAKTVLERIRRAAV